MSPYVFWSECLVLDNQLGADHWWFFSQQSAVACSSSSENGPLSTLACLLVVSVVQVCLGSRVFRFQFLSLAHTIFLPPVLFKYF